MRGAKLGGAMTEESVYRDLQKHLDELPVGYPPTQSGVEIRILKHLFTPLEARVATQLSLIPEPLSRIHARAGEKLGMSLPELERVLDKMVRKGTILTRGEHGEKCYGNAMLVVGMFELQVDRMTKGFARDMQQYLDEAFGHELFRSRTPQLRTIPVHKSIAHGRSVSTYDDVRQIIDAVQGQIAVANCICRQGKDVLGTGCNHTSLRETCLIFDAMAQQHLDIGLARRITKQEALDILAKAEEAGLVLQPENVQRPHYICCCCGDCCGVLSTLKKYPRPVEFYASNHRAMVDTDRCNGCGECADRCQLAAVTVVDGMARINLDRCIGCGNCVVSCTLHAIQLEKKDEETVPPLGTKALYLKIMTGKAES
jgi:electron transport complex protein RnfB